MCVRVCCFRLTAVYRCICRVKQFFIGAGAMVVFTVIFGLIVRKYQVRSMGGGGEVKSSQ